MVNLDNAKIIQFPYFGKEYVEYNLNDNIHYLPLCNKDMLYDGMEKNSWHYTTKYAYTVVLPFLNDLLDFKFNINDFKLIKHIYTENNKEYDLSYIVPLQRIFLEIYGYDYNNYHEINLYERFINRNMIYGNTPYHLLYIFSHSCSRIINKKSITNKKLFISGDSLMVPCILPLSYYYNEVCYFDNRSGYDLKIEDVNYDKVIEYSKYIENIDFDDKLIELYNNPIEKYTRINVK